MPLPAFAPTGSASIVAGPTSGLVTIPTAGTPTQVVVTNMGASPVFIALGDGTITASVATGFPVLPGGVAVLTIGAATAIAAITTGPSAAIRISAGT